MAVLDPILPHSGGIMATAFSLPSLAVLLVLGLLGFFSASTYTTWRRLKHIPGPPSAGLSKWWMLRNTLGGSMHLALKAACDTHGKRWLATTQAPKFSDLFLVNTKRDMQMLVLARQPETSVEAERIAARETCCHVARVGPNTLVTDDPEVVKRMWAVRSAYKKADFYDAVRFDPTRDNIISQRDDDLHNELRAKMAAGYAGKENEGLERGIDKGIMGFIGLIERNYVSEGAIFRPMDLARKAQYLTMDIIGDIAFGADFGHLTQDADVHEYIARTEASMPAMMIVSVLPVLARMMQLPLLRRFMPSEKDPHGFGKFIGVAKRVVAERLGPNGIDRKDMLGSFLKHGLTREEAEGEALVNIIAGSDTTATAIRTTMLYLMSSPQAYRKLAHEIRTAASKGQISSPITDDEARTLPYLQAVIKEGMRVFPPVTGLMPTVVPPGGDVIRGIPVPEGTEIGWSAFGVQHNKGVYGLDAETFRPERWLEVKDEALLQEMTSTWELVFKYGKWQCLGRSVALLELNKIFVELLRRYDFGLLNPPSPWNSFSAGIFIQSELWVKVTRI